MLKPNSHSSVPGKDLQLEQLLDDNKYVCPMHSHIHSSETGSCPICGMDLVLNKNQSSLVDIKQKQYQQDPSDSEYPEVRISPQVKHNLGIRTAIVKKGDLNHQIQTIGKITRVDPMARTRITSPINGTLIEMVDKYSGAKVKQDEFLFSVASDELFALEKTFQLAFLSSDKATASAMIPRLVEMGLDAEQLAALQNGVEPVLVAKVYALEDGFIFTRRGEVGDHVTTAFTVFNLGGNYQVIEVTVEIFERQWDLVKEGQTASMELRNLPGKIFHGIVERVDEPVGYTTRALESRLKFKTDHKGMTQSTFARVIIDGKSTKDILILPKDAVIRTAQGSRVVKVIEAGVYQPVSVLIGEQADGKVEVLAGLKQGDKVVASGQFLLDSESSLSIGLDRLSRREESSINVTLVPEKAVN